jgi:hypothetical protein
MKTAAATLRRLLQALEDLGFREDGALACGDGLAFLALEQQAQPLVNRVVELAMSPEPMDPALRERGAALVASRSERRVRLTRLLETTRDEISRLNEARARLRAVRPAYTPASGGLPSPAFAACG